MKYILSMARISWDLNMDAVQTYLYQNKSSHSTTTFWKDILELEPAHTLTLKSGQVTKKKYWNFQPSLIQRTPKEAFEKNELFKFAKDYYRKKGTGRPTKKD